MLPLSVEIVQVIKDLCGEMNEWSGRWRRWVEQPDIIFCGQCVPVSVNIDNGNINLLDEHLSILVKKGTSQQKMYTILYFWPHISQM